jgi:type IV fimbrial biogenesis protein FimT
MISNRGESRSYINPLPYRTSDTTSTRQTWVMHIQGHGTGSPLPSAFTVLELLVTLAVAAVLLMTGLPSFQRFAQQQQMKAAVNGLQHALLLARNEAVHRNAPVVACPGNATDGCSGDPDWSRGWIVYPDSNDDRQRQAGESLLLEGQLSGNLSISSSPGRTSIRFLGDGSTPGSNAQIGFCGPGGPPHARKLVISNIGRIRRDLYPEIDPEECPSP